MKYFCLGDNNYKDAEQLRVLWKQVLDERAKGSDRFPKKLLFEPHFFTVSGLFGKNDTQSFFIFETDNEEHLRNYMMHFADIVDVKIIPILDSKKAMLS